MGKRSPNAKRLKPCMPPLLDEEIQTLISTNYSGACCEHIVKSYFLSKQINIAEPTVDDGVDLLIEKKNGWARGQIKKVVYTNKLDSGMKKRGIECQRSRFSFFFQGGGGKNGNKRQRKLQEIDYFYHILLTPYRQLIWETPSNLVPLRENEEFISAKDVCLDRNNWIRKKADINFNDLLVNINYHPIVFKSYPQFFSNEEENTVESLFD